MAQQLHPSDTDLSFLMILMLMSYVLCSAPKFIRQMKNYKKEIRIEAVTPIKTLIKAGRFYAIEPYKRMWTYLQSDVRDAPLLTQKIKQTDHSVAQ
jgi:hypothetical protein